MTQPAPVIFFVDVDNTLFDGDHLVDDLKRHIANTLREDQLAEYWQVFETRRAEFGYVDYLGALEQYRNNCPTDQRCQQISAILIDYPYVDRVFPGAMDVLRQLGSWGTTVIVSDGDTVLQPRKITRSGLRDAVDGRVLIYIHKEHQLADIEARYPADHYVFVDDKPRIVDALKRAWGGRVTTILPRQGHYALDPKETAACTLPPDLTINTIADLLNYDLSTLLAAAGPASR